LRHEDSPVTISQHIIKLFLDTKEIDKSFPLYCYYYYKTKKQFTSSIDCSDSVAGDELRWSRTKVLKNRTKLQELGLVSIKIAKNSLGLEVKRYIVVNYEWGKSEQEVPVFENNPEVSAISLKTSNAVSSGVIDFKTVGSSEVKDQAECAMLFDVPMLPDRTYSINAKMSVGVAAEMIKKNGLEWTSNISLHTTGDHNDFVTVIVWWLNGFTIAYKKRLGKEYGGIRFDYIKEKFINWVSKPGSRRLEVPYRTLIVFYEKQMTAPDYVESKSLILAEMVKEIEENSCEWKKDIVFSLRGTKEDYDTVLYWWFTNMSDEYKAEIFKIYGIKDVSTIAYQLYLELKSEVRRSSSPHERLVRKLNYIATKR